MNDEIKEILDYLKDEKWDYCPGDMTPFKVFFMEERDKLLDYITNLQHTKEYLGEVLYEKDKELEKLNNKIKHYEETTTFGDYIKEVNLLVDYKSRIEKAVEYIKNCPEYLWANVNTKELLNILNGRSDE